MNKGDSLVIVSIIGVDHGAKRLMMPNGKEMTVDISQLTNIMQQLRDPDTGCPWDKEQDFASIAPYTVEEAYEVVEAIEQKDFDALQDELGDLLLQVVFHSQMAAEANIFDINDVVSGISNKMIRRHPHIFTDLNVENSEDVRSNWEDIKANERKNKTTVSGALSGVALALPALLRAQKIQKRAARTGFDWPDISGAFDKVDEEILELKAAETPEDRHEEMGDLLFAMVNICRFMDIDAEQALRDATRKFEGRFAYMEKQDANFDRLSLEEKEELWKLAKVDLKT
jgi:nucleoside triphosphate diphosphatase